MLDWARGALYCRAPGPESTERALIVSHAHRFIFLRTEKTGGTGLVAALKAACAPGDTYPGQIRPAWSRRLPFRYDGLQRSMPDVFGLHPYATARQARRVLGPRIFDSYFKFSVERNPWDRQVELYAEREWKKGRDHANFDRDMRSLAYRSAESCRLDNWSVYAIGNEVVVDRMLRYEALADDFADICRLIGLEPGDRAARLSRPRTRRPHYSLFYSDFTRDMLARWYWREIQTFGYRFEDRRGGRRTGTTIRLQPST
jgi:hypothetical protein